MWPALFTILRGVGTAATGYWLNDFGAWIANVTGFGSKVVATDGKTFKWWYVLIVAVVLGAAVYSVIWLLMQLAPKRYRK